MGGGAVVVIVLTIRFKSFELVRRCRRILWAASSTSDDRKLGLLFRSFELLRECDDVIDAGIPLIMADDDEPYF